LWTQKQLKNDENVDLGDIMNDINSMHVDNQQQDEDLTYSTNNNQNLDQKEEKGKEKGKDDNKPHMKRKRKR